MRNKIAELKIEAEIMSHQIQDEYREEIQRERAQDEAMAKEIENLDPSQGVAERRDTSLSLDRGEKGVGVRDTNGDDMIPISTNVKKY
jgi:hypothetical protein